MKRIAGNDFYWEYYGKKVNAHQVVLQAIKRGELIRPDTCELCGKRPEKMTVRPPEPTKRRKWKQENRTRPGIFAHHWRGYDSLEAILDVWWICHHCNRRLYEEKYHNGSVTKEEARGIIEAMINPPRVYQKPAIIHTSHQCAGTSNTKGRRCRRRVVDSHYCRSHKPASLIT